VETITFASSNQNKYLEVQLILSAQGISVDFSQIHLVELQSNSLEDIAREKAKSAFAKLNRPVIVEDDGLFIDCLGGFPGPYSSFVSKTIGNDGILKLLSGSTKRSGYFCSLIAFYNGKTLSISEGRVEGRISERIAGSGGWGYDPIFVPSGTNLSFTELTKNKNAYSHRKRALEQFAQWYLHL
jgi:XTP/dITP diphosphohydrolase